MNIQEYQDFLKSLKVDFLVHAKKSLHECKLELLQTFDQLLEKKEVCYDDMMKPSAFDRQTYEN